MIGVASFFVDSAVAPVGAYSVFISPEFLFQTNIPVGSATSSIASTNVSNGVGPYTYLWIQESGDSMTINSPTGDNTTFTTSGSSGEIKAGTFKVTVTDTGNGNAETDDTITVTFSFEGVPL